MDDKEIYYSLANSGISWIDWLFDKAVYLLIRLSEATGLSYWEINVWIFVIIGPLTLIFSILLNIYLLKKLKKNNTK
ncbi:MAG: hypothetical protein QF864_12810 [SAR202 cluster bacterium]|jgi:hypothetical protein|nr:hypothetical protein [SAR202 cluster bacterium]